MSNPNIVIKTQNLSKFIQTKPIVYRLNLEIPEGTLYGLLGPNGAGKTTTLKLLTGMIKPTSGMVSIFGLDPWENRVKLNKEVGYLPQNPVQHKEKTVLDFMIFMARLRGLAKKEAVKEARNSLDSVGLGRFEEQIVGKLSGGETQRLGFANAMLGDPKLLILDEPTASLDPEGRVYVMELIERLSRDRSRTIVISSHILPEIQRMTNHIAIMSEGSVLASGNMQKLTKGIYDTEYEIQCSNPEKIKSILISNGYETRINGRLVITHIDGNHSEFWTKLPRICVNENIKLKSFKPLRDSLETLFLELVSKKKLEEEEKNNE